MFTDALTLLPRSHTFFTKEYIIAGSTAITGVHHYSPLARRNEGQKVTLVAVIGELRSDLSLTRKTDGNHGNVSANVLICRVWPRLRAVAIVT